MSCAHLVACTLHAFASCICLAGAWRKVGVLSRTTDGSQIDRTHFCDQEPAAEAEDAALPGPSPGRKRKLQRSIAEVAKTPPGLRSGSLAAVNAKVAALKEHAELQQSEIARLEELPFDPAKVPGLLEPKPH